MDGTVIRGQNVGPGGCDWYHWISVRLVEVGKKLPAVLQTNLNAGTGKTGICQQASQEAYQIGGGVEGHAHAG